MPVNQWRGDAPATATEIIVTVLSAVANALYVVAIGQARYQYRADADDTAGDIADQLADRLATSPDVEVDHEDGSAVIRVIGREVGSPLPVTPVPTPLLSVQTVTPGKAAQLAEIDLQLPATTSGGTWAFDLSIDGAAAQSITGLAHNITADALETAIAAQHTGVSSGDVAVELTSTSPRTYRLTLQDALAGQNATADIDASALLGNATVDIRTAQDPGAIVNELQALHLGGNAGDNPSIAVRWTDPITGDPIQTGDTSWGNADMQALIDTLCGEGNTRVVTVRHLAETIMSVFVEFVGQLSGTPQAQLELIVTETGDPATYASTRLKTGGGTDNNEFQLVAFLPNAIDQQETTTYTLTRDGQTTAAINKFQGGGSSGETDLAGAESALEALANTDAVTIHGHPFTLGQPWYVVEFVGSDANTAVSQLDISESPGQEDPTQAQHLTDTLSNGNPLLNQIDRVIVTADGGTWTMTADGDTTAALTWPTTAAQLESALATARGTSDFTVIGDGTNGTPFFVEYIGNLANTNVTSSGSSAALTGGKAGTESYPVAGIPGVDEVQRLAIDKTATGGHVRIGFSGAFSPAIDHPFTAANIQAGLDDHPAIGSGNATVEGPPAGPWLVTFGGALGWQDVPLMTIDGDQLEVPESAAMSVEIAEKGTGPEWFNEPLNWTLERVPTTGDEIWFPHGNTPCTRGLRQRQTWTTSANSFAIQLGGESVLDAADFVDGQILRATSTGTLPAARIDDGMGGTTPLTIDADTDLHILAIDPYGKTAQLGYIDGGGFMRGVEFLDEGTGVHTIELRPAQIVQHLAHTGAIGLPPRDSNTQAWEDQTQFLQIGVLAATGDDYNLIIGDGAGSGSSRVRIDFGTAPLKALIIDSGSGIGRPAVELIVDNLTAAELEQLGGDVGIALEPDHSAQLRRIVKRSGSLRIGNATIKDGIEADAFQADRVTFDADGRLTLRT